MTRQLRDDRGAALALALLRTTLVAVIFLTQQLVDSRQLGGSGFFALLGVGAAYAVAGIVIAARGIDNSAVRALTRFQPGIDVLLLVGLAYTSGGGYSDVRKAFFVIPLAAAFSERPRSTAGWSFLAVVAFSFVAVLARGHLTGVMNSWERTTLNQDLYLAWTGAAATLLAFGLRRRTAHIEELASSRQRLVTQAIESVERERTRLAGALHDAPVQNLIAARHDLRRAERTGEEECFRRLHEAIDSTLTELREEIFKLHPHVLDHVGLSAALEQVARHHSRNSTVEITVKVDPEDGLDNQQALFALGRELLANAAKHAHASQIRLDLRRERGSVVLEVGDDGCGIPDGRMRQALLDGHVGLAAVKERVAVLGGVVRLDTRPGMGTSVRITLPAPEDPERRGAVASDRVTAFDTLRVSTV